MSQSAFQHLHEQSQLQQQISAHPQLHSQHSQHSQPQHSLLLERRIIELLTQTNLTFKEIILKLEGENLSASIGIIRRINRDNRYRRPRYDSKLTPAQRESLVEELRDHNGLKPNLSLLAKRYGVCHGSVWYWWDKLNRIKHCGGRSGGKLAAFGQRQRYGGPTGRNRLQGARLRMSAAGSSVGELVASTSQDGTTSPSEVGDEDGGGEGGSDDQDEESHESSSSSSLSLLNRRHRALSSREGGLAAKRGFGGHSSPSSMRPFFLNEEKYNFVGRVSIVARERNEPIDLPILMFSRRELLDMSSVKTCGGSSLASSGGESLAELSSPSPMVVVDEDEADDEEEDLERGSSGEFGSSIGSPLLLLGSETDQDRQLDPAGEPVVEGGPE